MPGGLFRACANSVMKKCAFIVQLAAYNTSNVELGSFDSYASLSSFMKTSLQLQ